jgi:hypothetical protein
MRQANLPAAVIAVALLTCAAVSAQAAQLATDPNAGTDVVVNDPVHPLAPQSITQSTDPYTIQDNTSIACVGAVTTENAWLRLFDLDDDHGLVDTFTVESVDWGTQRAVGPVDLTLSVYCLDEGLPFLYQFMDVRDSTALSLADIELEFHNTAIGGSCDTATEDMAVEIFAEHCDITGCISYFVGMNTQGETAPAYIASASCGIPEPLDLSVICFGIDCDLVMVVNGDGVVGDDGGADDGGGSDVPATTGVGAVLLLLTLLGSGAYFLRRGAS